MNEIALFLAVFFFHDRLGIRCFANRRQLHFTLRFSLVQQVSVAALAHQVPGARVLGPLFEQLPPVAATIVDQNAPIIGGLQHLIHEHENFVVFADEIGRLLRPEGLCQRRDVVFARFAANHLAQPVALAQFLVTRVAHFGQVLHIFFAYFFVMSEGSTISNGSSRMRFAP